MDTNIAFSELGIIVLGIALAVLAMMNYSRHGVNQTIGSALLFFSLVHTWFLSLEVNSVYFIGQEATVFGLGVVVWLGWSATILHLGLLKVFEKHTG